MSTTSAMNRAAISGPTPYRSVKVVSAAATIPVICRFSSAVSVSMVMTRSRRRRHNVARMLVLVADQLECGPDPGAGGQDRDLLLVAGSQTAQFGVGPVDQAAAFTNQVLAVVEQRAQIRSRADGQPNRR